MAEITVGCKVKWTNNARGLEQSGTGKVTAIRPRGRVEVTATDGTISKPFANACIITK